LDALSALSDDAPVTMLNLMRFRDRSLDSNGIVYVGAVAPRESTLPKSCDRRAVASARPIGGLNRHSTTRPPRRTATSSTGLPNRLKHVF
jgi:hypothetical protein